jgi:hypothetical protein
MSEADFVRIAEAYRRSCERTAATIRNLWAHGSTLAPIAVEFCAADFILGTIEVTQS